MKTQGGQEIQQLPLSLDEKTRATVTYSLTNFILAKKWDFTLLLFSKEAGLVTGNPGSVIVPQYRSSKITVFVWGKNTILKFLGNTK